MTTVATLLIALKYDLRNYGDIDYDSDQIVHYLNRTVNILDQRLANFQSDMSFTQEEVTLTAGTDYVACPTRCLAIREVWIENRRKTQESQGDLKYRRQFRRTLLESGDSVVVGEYHKTIAQNTTDLTGLGAANNTAGTYWTCTVAGTLGASDTVWKLQSGEPMFWTHWGDNIQLETAPGSAYVVSVFYDIYTDTLTSASDMPYNGIYDDVIREVLVQMLIHKKHKVDSQTDAVYTQIFDQMLHMSMVNKTFVRKNYKLDF